MLQCSDQQVKYRMPHGFPLTSSLLLDYHIKQYTYTSETIFIQDIFTPALAVISLLMTSCQSNGFLVYFPEITE